MYSLELRGVLESLPTLLAFMFEPGFCSLNSRSRADRGAAFIKGFSFRGSRLDRHKMAVSGNGIIAGRVVSRAYARKLSWIQGTTAARFMKPRRGLDGSE